MAETKLNGAHAPWWARWLAPPICFVCLPLIITVATCSAKQTKQALCDETSSEQLCTTSTTAQGALVAAEAERESTTTTVAPAPKAWVSLRGFSLTYACPAGVNLSPTGVDPNGDFRAVVAAGCIIDGGIPPAGWSPPAVYVPVAAQVVATVAETPAVTVATVVPEPAATVVDSGGTSFWAVVLGVFGLAFLAFLALWVRQYRKMNRQQDGRDKNTRVAVPDDDDHDIGR